jgi:hypothetical protein
MAGQHDILVRTLRTAHFGDHIARLGFGLDLCLDLHPNLGRPLFQDASQLIGICIGEDQDGQLALLAAGSLANMDLPFRRAGRADCGGSLYHAVSGACPASANSAAAWALWIIAAEFGRHGFQPTGGA